MKHIPIQNMACKYAEKDINGEDIDIKEINKKIDSSSGTKYYLHTCNAEINVGQYVGNAFISFINTDSTIYNSNTILNGITNYCKKVQSTLSNPDSIPGLIFTVTFCNPTNKYYGTVTYAITWNANRNSLKRIYSGYIIDNGNLVFESGGELSSGLKNTNNFGTIEL